MLDPTLSPRLNDILRTLREQLAQALGHDLAQVIVYGSQARAEARPDSDIDVLIVMNGSLDYTDLMQRTSALVAELSLQHDVVISRTFASTAQWENAGTPFLINVRREGVAL
jgi:predicted nucleotidyltransferase